MIEKRGQEYLEDIEIYIRIFIFFYIFYTIFSIKLFNQANHILIQQLDGITQGPYKQIHCFY